jgi:hypothetical protein
MENKNNKTLFVFLLFLLFNSCIQELKKDIKSSSKDPCHKIVIYELDSSIINFIEDSIFFNDKCKVKSCNIHTHNSITELTFGYTDDDYFKAGEILLENNTRYLKINKREIPLTFDEDLFFIGYDTTDQKSDNTKTTNWFNYAVLKFNYSGEILEYENFYKKYIYK